MKKKFTKILSVLLAIIFVFSAFSVSVFARAEEPKKGSLAYECIKEDETKKESFSLAPKMIAHRGYSAYYPQNTIPAFEKAAEAKFWGIECDIHSTKDGRWIIIHDDEISALTDGEGYIKDKTFEEVQEIRMDSGNGIENYGTLPLPTLEEYLEICKNGNVVPVIEIKTCIEKYLPSLKEILDSFEMSEKAIIISFDKNYLLKYRAIDENAQMFLLLHEPTKESVDFCIENNFGIDYNCKNLVKCLPGLIYAGVKNVPIGAWTVDSKFVSFVLRLFGAKYITTNKIAP